MAFFSLGFFEILIIGGMVLAIVLVVAVIANVRRK